VEGGPPIRFSDPIAATVRTRAYLVPLEPTTAQVIGRCDALCLGVRNSYGRGVAYYFGTYMGLALAAGDDEAGKLIAAIITQYCPAKVRGTRLRPRLIEGDSGEALLAVFNDSRTQRLADRITVPSEFKMALDVDRDEPIVLDGSALSLEVDAEDVRVFHLSP